MVELLLWLWFGAPDPAPPPHEEFPHRIMSCPCTVRPGTVCFCCHDVLCGGQLVRAAAHPDAGVGDRAAKVLWGALGVANEGDEP